MRCFTLNNGRNEKDFICGNTNQELFESLKITCNQRFVEPSIFMTEMAERIYFDSNTTIRTDTIHNFLWDLLNFDYLIEKEIQ